MLQNLKEQLLTAEGQLEGLQSWLNDNTQHADFMKVAGDRNHLLVKINAIEFKINQVERGLPILGEADELMTVIDLEYLHHGVIINKKP